VAVPLCGDIITLSSYSTGILGAQTGGGVHPEGVLSFSKGLESGLTRATMPHQAC
jgi:hypothetical protein